jgi:uncharacterized damage-inducible protein DinB
MAPSGHTKLDVSGTVGQTTMTPKFDPTDALIAAWKTNNRVTGFLFESLPSELWPMAVPGMPRRTVRMIAGHIHNVRCMWIKMLGKRYGISVPNSVNRYTVTRRELLRALERSSDGILELLELGIHRDGRIPASGVPWLNLPLDVMHVLTYFVAHEGHHRGQIVLLARQTGHRLPSEITGGLWQWSKRAKEARARDP